jgi:hypothetical protein
MTSPRSRIGVWLTGVARPTLVFGLLAVCHLAGARAAFANCNVSGSPCIAYVNRTQAVGNSVSSLTIANHFVDPAEANQAVLVFVSVRSLGQFPRGMDATFAGLGMTLNISNSIGDGGSGRMGVAVFSLVNPADGVNDAVITFRDGAGNPVTVSSVAAVAISLYSVDQSRPIFNGNVLDSDASPAEIVLATRDGGVSIDVLATLPTELTSPAAGQTQNWTVGPAVGLELRASGSARENSATGTVLMTHVLTPPTARWIKAGVSLRPAPVGLPLNQPPVANATDVTVIAGPGCAANASINNGSSDPDGDPITIAQTPPGPYPIGSTLVTLTVTDSHGESSEDTATVTVVDDTLPSVFAPPNVSATTGGPGSTAAGAHISDAALGTAGATDNCSAVNVIRSGVPAGNFFPVGSTTITYVATDAGGNSATATQIVTVGDDTPPVVAVPGGTTVDAISPAGAPVAYAVSATDNVGVVSFICSPATGSVIPIGTSMVSCTASDAAGNSASNSFSIRVRGAEEQIVELIELARAMPLSPALRATILRALDRALDNPRHVGGVCSALNAFITLVRSRSGRTIPADRADQLVADATRIKAVLGCP